MNKQFNYSSQATVGQLFDKAVDKMMNDQKFKSSMEQKSNYNSWSSSSSGSPVRGNVKKKTVYLKTLELGANFGQKYCFHGHSETFT